QQVCDGVHLASARGGGLGPSGSGGGLGRVRAQSRASPPVVEVVPGDKATGRHPGGARTVGVEGGHQHVVGGDGGNAGRGIGGAAGVNCLARFRVNRVGVVHSRVAGNPPHAVVGHVGSP